jgi:hypothetical protein
MIYEPLPKGPMAKIVKKYRNYFLNIKLLSWLI